jgi:hypothetical protein
MRRRRDLDDIWIESISVVGHNQVLQSINELLNCYGIPCTVTESQIPGRRRVTLEARVRFLWNFALVDRSHQALFDIYRTGEVRHGYCGTDDEATKIQKAIFLKLKARVTSLVARSAASRMLPGLHL